MRQKFFIPVAFLLAVIPLLTGNCVTTHYVVDKTTPGAEPARTYTMSQKVFSFGDRFVIKDEHKTPVFFVKGKVISLGDRLRFLDAEGNELAYIKERVPSIKKTYKIFRDGRLLARVKKRITLVKDKFIIDIPGSTGYIVTGNFGRHQYTFSRDGREVALVSKKFISVGDKYRIEIAPGEDDVLILAAVTIIDMASHDDPHL